MDSRSRTGCVALERRAARATAPAAPPAGSRNHRHLCRPKRPALVRVCERLDRRGESSGQAEFYGPHDGLEAGVYRAIYQDQNGVIWLGGVEGLTRFADGRFATLHAANGFPAGSVTAIVEDDAGCLWLAIQGVAIVQIRRTELEKALANASYRPHYSVYDSVRWPRGNAEVVRASQRRARKGWPAVVRGRPRCDGHRSGGVSQWRAPRRFVSGSRAPTSTIGGCRLMSQTELPPRTTRLEIQYAVLESRLATEDAVPPPSRRLRCELDRCGHPHRGLLHEPASTQVPIPGHRQQRRRDVDRAGSGVGLLDRADVLSDDLVRRALRGRGD